MNRALRAAAIAVLLSIAGCYDGGPIWCEFPEPGRPAPIEGVK